MSWSDVPMLNAVLNAIAATLLLIGHSRIKRGQVSAHRAFMISAFVVSLLFIASYLTYHAHAGVVHFGGEGLSRIVYFSLLSTHTVLAAAVPILAIITLTFGLRGRYEKHKKIARWTYPMWLYVSATGVVIYLMLFQFFPHY